MSLLPEDSYGWYVAAIGLAVIVIVIVVLALSGCTLHVETRSSAECGKDQCKAETSIKRQGETDPRQRD